MTTLVLCRCGHPQVRHFGPEGKCLIRRDSVRCACEHFELAHLEVVGRERKDVG